MNSFSGGGGGGVCGTGNNFGAYSVCPGSVIQFASDIANLNYRWQVDMGSGFINIINNAIYAGAATRTLSINNPPTSWYGYQYRCVTSGTSSINSVSYFLKFQATWIGSKNKSWEDAANWNCGVLPDANPDVTIISGITNTPEVGSNIFLHSLKLSPHSSINVKAGYKIVITGK